jgi:hypothetical protein
MAIVAYQYAIDGYIDGGGNMSFSVTLPTDQDSIIQDIAAAMNALPNSFINSIQKTPSHDDNSNVPYPPE